MNYRTNKIAANISIKTLRKCYNLVDHYYEMRANIMEHCNHIEYLPRGLVEIRTFKLKNTMAARSIELARVILNAAKGRIIELCAQLDVEYNEWKEVIAGDLNSSDDIYQMRLTIDDIVKRIMPELAKRFNGEEGVIQYIKFQDNLIHMNELILLSPSHIITVLLSLLAIIYVPKYFKSSANKTKEILKYAIIFLLLINQGMDFYREGILSNRWEDGLPLHLCDFSTMAIILYFITQKRDFFIFAFFFGIAGGGMSILTPDTVYGFPYVGYIQSQIGHTMILMGVTYAMIIDKHRPYIGDVPKALFYASILLIFTYLMNYLLGTNYWFLAEKPIGDNITSFMRPEPFHIIDLYIAAILICYAMYLPYYLKDRSKG